MTRQPDYYVVSKPHIQSILIMENLNYGESLNTCFTNPPITAETRRQETKSTFIHFIIIFAPTRLNAGSGLGYHVAQSKMVTGQFHFKIILFISTVDK